jgi:hypothetical protein
MKNIQLELAQKDKEATDMKELADAKSRVKQVLSSITGARYKTLYAFVDQLLNVQDQQLSSCVSKMLGQNSKDILNNIHACQPDLVTQ